MRLYDVNGRLVKKNITRFLIKWDGPSRSMIQYKTKQFLKPFWCGVICYEEAPCFGSLLKVDILTATLSLAVEVNGKQHESINSFFHKGNPANYLKGIKNDEKKLIWLRKNNFKLIEIMENEVPMLSTAFFKEKFGIALN